MITPEFGRNSGLQLPAGRFTCLENLSFAHDMGRRISFAGTVARLF
jgi:hypothetical protein